MHGTEDWKDNIELIKIGWANLKKMLYESQTELISLFDRQDDSYLQNAFLDTDYNFHYLIEGIIHHDLYHLGQIGITIKLLNK